MWRNVFNLVVFFILKNKKSSQPMFKKNPVIVISKERK